MRNLDSFKAYDIRGRIPDEINESLAYDIGRAYAAFVKPRRVAVGYDIRLSSPQLAAALKRGLMDCGTNVLDIGLWGTEGSYFATFAEHLDGGLMVTASHNPPDYNGMKFVREEARPISADTGLQEMRRLIETGQLPAKAALPGTEEPLDIRAKYLEHLLGYVDRKKLKKLKIVTNAGNGGAGLIVDALEPHLPFEFVKLNNDPDGHFPHGVPNPMLEENRAATADRAAQGRRGRRACLGWRLRSLLLLRRERAVHRGLLPGGASGRALPRAGARRAHRPRSAPHLEHARHRAPSRRHGRAVQVRPRLHQGQDARGRRRLWRRDERAPLLSPLLLLRQRHDSVAAGAGRHERERQAAVGAGRASACGCFRRAARSTASCARTRSRYWPGCGRTTRAQTTAIDLTDGLSMEFEQWRFNLRGSNTEPLVRLNVESRADEGLMREKTAELLRLIDG